MMAGTHHHYPTLAGAHHDGSRVWKGLCAVLRRTTGTRKRTLRASPWAALCPHPLPLLVRLQAESLNHEIKPLHVYFKINISCFLCLEADVLCHRRLHGKKPGGT